MRTQEQQHWIDKGKQQTLKDELKWLNENYDIFDDLYCVNEKIWKDRVRKIEKELGEINE
jgi:hypothetical protein